jgi:hypothetical protein
VTGQIETQIDRGYLAPETRTAATRYLTRTDNADLLPILGLVGGPGPAERTQAKALAAAVRPGFCPTCQNKLPGHGVCRRSKACREAARERGEPASPYLCPVHSVHLRWGKCSECAAGGAR